MFPESSPLCMVGYVLLGGRVTVDRAPVVPTYLPRAPRPGAGPVGRSSRAGRREHPRTRRCGGLGQRFAGDTRVFVRGQEHRECPGQRSYTPRRAAVCTSLTLGFHTAPTSQQLLLPRKSPRPGGHPAEQTGHPGLSAWPPGATVTLTCSKGVCVGSRPLPLNHLQGLPQVTSSRRPGLLRLQLRWPH